MLMRRGEGACSKLFRLWRNVLSIHNSSMAFAPLHRNHQTTRANCASPCCARRRLERCNGGCRIIRESKRLHQHILCWPPAARDHCQDDETSTLFSRPPSHDHHEPAACDQSSHMCMDALYAPRRRARATLSCRRGSSADRTSSSTYPILPASCIGRSPRGWRTLWGWARRRARWPAHPGCA